MKLSNEIINSKIQIGEGKSNLEDELMNMKINARL